MEYGIFSSVYGEYGIEEAASRIREAGFRYVQFVPVLDGRFLQASDFTPEHIRRIRAAYTAAGLKVIAVSGGHGFLHPDPERQKRALENARRWIELAPELGASLVVTEIGSTHPDHNWTDHPNNHTAETWEQAVHLYAALAGHAKAYGVTIGIEPHFASVINGVERLRRLLDDVGEPNLKAVLDPANIVTAANRDRLEQELAELFRLAGKDFVLAHAKDTRIEEGESVFVPAGQGILPYPGYVGLLREHGYRGPLVLEYLGERDVERTLRFLRGHDVAPYMKPVFEGDERLYQALQAVQELNHAPEGALALKYRLLLSMVADALRNHPAGAVACAKEALAAGATREQAAEAMRVVYAAGGLPLLIENIDVYREVLLR